MPTFRWRVNGERQIDVRVTQRVKGTVHNVSLQSSVTKFTCCLDAQIFVSLTIELHDAIYMNSLK